MIEAISHVALVVADPGRTARLFDDLFGAKAIRRVDEDGHDETFLKLGGIWFALIKGDAERKRTGDHIAFRGTPAELSATTDKLKTLGLEFMLARSDTSLYFFDYDNHVFELDTIGVDAGIAGVT